MDICMIGEEYVVHDDDDTNGNIDRKRKLGESPLTKLSIDNSRLCMMILSVIMHTLFFLVK